MATNTPWTFLSYWGFLGLAIIHFVDGLIAYMARTPVYDTEIFRNHKFLSLLTRREWNRNEHPPSSLYVYSLLLPGFICFTICLLILPNLPETPSAILLIMLIGLAWFISCKIFNDFLSQVYFACALFNVNPKAEAMDAIKNYSDKLVELLEEARSERTREIKKLKTLYKAAPRETQKKILKILESSSKKER